MDFFETINKRRSIRKFTEQIFPDEYVNKALEAAILAPNSSNTQTWDFHWIQSQDMKKKIVHCCLDQSAARTASQLLVITADPKNWKRSYEPLNNWVQNANAPKAVQLYYKKLIPISYRWGIFNLFAFPKWIFAFVIGVFRPFTRRSFTLRDHQEVAIKSAALAAENFVLAITALGGATCMMEGFDEWRIKWQLKLSYSSRVVMVIGIGYEAERGTWAPRFRLSKDKVIHIH